METTTHPLNTPQPQNTPLPQNAPQPQNAQQSQNTSRPLMTCKYCILYELGHCRRIQPMHNEPKYMRLKNGTRIRLEFDCKACEMRLYSMSLGV